ncbi:response regulator [Paraburkholderia sp. BL17N1]|uniref:response regulator n=1 Tax=Paraburkholderia sp. BL17N1 TaxID=1938798 RepID=UPI000EB2094E|nr:response regulator [Paraburkholderia sp. BL17N1]RKR36220.1 response regulator receiver domain-containing protein [Paraburkholderia sp. BL17N1]
MKAKRASALIGVVDDNEFARMGLASMLRAEGWKSATYSSAEQLLADTRRTKLQLVITDIQMPGIDGFALLAAIKLWAPPIPVICITAYATEAILARASADGAAGFFPKPVDDEELLALIAKLLCKGD